MLLLKTTAFDVPMQSLVKLTFPTHKPEECPMCKAGSTAEKPGSK